MGECRIEKDEQYLLFAYYYANGMRRKAQALNKARRIPEKEKLHVLAVA